MKRIRRIAMVFAVVAIAAMGLSAATWVWSTPYDNVTGYRYQIGSESEDGWIYVDKDVTSLTLDRSEETTIYVQLTVDDGRFWSPSGIATYVPQSVLPVENLTSQNQDVVDPFASASDDSVFDSIPEPDDEIIAEAESIIGSADGETEIVVTDEEVLPVEEETAEDVDVVDESEEILPEEEPVDETVYVEALPVKKGKDFNFAMGVSFESEFGVPDKTFSINPILNFSFQNVASPSDWFGLDINMNIVGLFKPNADFSVSFPDLFANIFKQNFAMGGGAELLFRPAFMVGNFEFGLSIGGGANIYAANTISGDVLAKIPSLYRNDLIQINAYALAGADITLNCNDVVDFGLGYRFRYVFDKEIKAGSQMTHSAVLALGFKF